jgi:radical SAM superfamily enzyme YgiQ (UPF0313 family)
MLDLAGISPRAEDRPWPGVPLILAGGIGAYNPEPLADFFDLFLVGDAEEGLPELLAAFRRLRPGASGKEDLLRALVKEVPGWYAPALYRSRYSPGGKFAGLEPRDASLPRVVRKRVLADLNLSAIRRPLVPVTEVVHDRTVVEVMRGCPRGCRFCAAGWTGRPVREKSPETVALQVRGEMEQSGAREVSLLSLSSGDYRGIEPVLTELAPALAARGISISLPSLNVASVKNSLLQAVRLVRKSGVTMAPEAGSPRLQGVINKRLDPELLWRVGREVKKMGWRLIKLYFMIGLPTETDADIRALAGMINRMAGWGGGLNVTISNFVPKAGTPFQWERFSPPGELRRKQRLIRDLVRSRRVKLKFRRRVGTRGRQLSDGIVAGVLAQPKIPYATDRQIAPGLHRAVARDGHVGPVAALQYHGADESASPIRDQVPRWRRPEELRQVLRRDCYRRVVCSCRSCWSSAFRLSSSTRKRELQRGYDSA